MHYLIIFSPFSILTCKDLFFLAQKEGQKISSLLSSLSGT